MARRTLLFISMSILALSACRRHGESSVVAPLSQTQIYDRAKPGTVAVVAQYEAAGTVASFALDTNRLGAAVRPRLGPGDTENQKMEKIFSVFLAAPGEYLREGEQQEISKTIGSLGTGFLVTPDGYILTNAHVVEPDQDDLKKAILDSISDRVQKDSAQIQRGIETLLPGETISEEATGRLKEALARQYLKSADFHFKKQISIVMPSPQGAEGEVNEQRCEIAKLGVRTPGRDVAVLKIEGTDLPTLPLAPGVEQGSVRPGSGLLIMGYPGKVSFDTSFTLRSRMQPSLSIGHVSGIKDMSDGWHVIQTDTTINPGNSGGPALNEFGQVVGQATFAETESQGLNFAIDIDVARQFLDELNVKPRESSFTRNYDLALQEYERPDHGKSLQMFRALSASHPDSGPVREFIRLLTHESGKSLAAVAPSPTPTPAPAPERVEKSAEDKPVRHRIPVGLLLIVGGLVVAVLAALIAANRR